MFVVHYELGKRPGTDEPQWQDRQKKGDVVTLYISSKFSAIQPEEGKTRFLAFEEKELHCSEDGRYRIVAAINKVALPEKEKQKLPSAASAPRRSAPAKPKVQKVSAEDFILGSPLQNRPSLRGGKKRRRYVSLEESTRRNSQGRPRDRKLGKNKPGGKGKKSGKK